MQVVVEIRIRLVNATYTLEGDDCLILTAHSTIDAVGLFLQELPKHAHDSLPATSQFINRQCPLPANLAPNHPDVVRAQQSRNVMWGKAQDIFRPVVAYHAKRFHDDAKSKGDLVQTTKIMSCGRLFNPSWVKLNNPSAASYNELSALNFVTPAEVGRMQQELVTMKVLCRGIVDVDARDFYRSNTAQLPTFTAVFRKLILVQPSSAMVERVFSILENSIHSTQRHMLLDSLSLSVMKRYNTRRLRRKLRATRVLDAMPPDSEEDMTEAEEDEQKEG